MKSILFYISACIVLPVFILGALGVELLIKWGVFYRNYVKK